MIISTIFDYYLSPIISILTILQICTMLAMFYKSSALFFSYIITNIKFSSALLLRHTADTINYTNLLFPATLQHFKSNYNLVNIVISLIPKPISVVQIHYTCFSISQYVR